MMIDMILTGAAYIMMVYFMVVLMKKKDVQYRDDEDDDDDGGIAIFPTPDLDLPPGVTLPDGSPSSPKKIKTDDLEEALA